MRLALGLLWLFQWLPLAVQAKVGNGLGSLAYLLARSRVRVARVNLQLCFPDWSEAERERLIKQHLQSFMRGALEHALLWWAPESRLRRLMRVEGWEELERHQGQPVILFAPHFMGLDHGGIRVAMDAKVCSMYAQQKNPAVTDLLLKARKRFGNAVLLSRQDGIRGLVRAVKRDKLPLYYLPDQDFGRDDAVFVPFFGTPAATITGLSRIARLTGAVVIPVVTRQCPGGEGYVTRFYPPLAGFPSEDVTRDTQRMNEFIEARVREMPAQYFWTHKRFKTRPDGEASFY
ncbi:KDO2-lipid IV(A) lauroyltransferase [Chitinivorax tropicus]|uniref:KDO2-lipid IV(A) lauroyltransferase n=1 Tax=Chitinivorax tropicus TaxID=714531 RepID=A0A840MIH6_9PROT|nr:lipid A biosynthesis acyltransferase [Chitinivorax tropicus]MBB5019014.1 KDO2-lipid IV(A) lauroyltransferase [Chitinivorax tropicus]